MGGGNFTVPVQRVTDFLQNKLSGNSIFLNTQFLFDCSNFGLFLVILDILVLLKQKHLYLHQAID